MVELQSCSARIRSGAKGPGEARARPSCTQSLAC